MTATAAGPLPRTAGTSATDLLPMAKDDDYTRDTGPIQGAKTIALA